MNVNLKCAAQNTYEGIKRISDIIEELDGSGVERCTQDLIDAINDVMVDCQPQLGAYCLLEHFNGSAINDK